MLDLHHISAAGYDLREAGLQVGNRLGFTLSRATETRHVRVVLGDGYLDLWGKEPGEWQWYRTTLWTRDLPSVEAAASDMFTERVPNEVRPQVVHLQEPERPQHAMEPDRARVVVEHANTAVGLGGFMVVVPVAEGPFVVRYYEQLLGQPATPAYEDSILGITAQDIPMSDGKRVVVGVNTFGTGPSAGFPTGIFAPIIRVRSLRVAGETLRAGAVYAYFNTNRLFTASALPGYGAMSFEQV